jgi:hypothetical protein
LSDSRTHPKLEYTRDRHDIHDKIASDLIAIFLDWPTLG